MRDLLNAGRAAHDLLLTDTCTIAVETKGSFNDATGKRMPIMHEIYSGSCRVKNADPVQIEAGERRNVANTPVLELSASDKTMIPERAVVTMTSSLNPNLVGAVFHIVGPDVSSTATSRRFTIERRS